MNNLYLYLGRRDKKGIRILAKFQGTSQMATRIDNLAALIPPELAGPINQIIYDSRMMWEPWIESADSYNDLRASLKMRGYSGVPVSPQPEYSPAATQKPIVDTSSLPQRTTMLRKKN